MIESIVRGRADAVLRAGEAQVEMVYRHLEDAMRRQWIKRVTFEGGSIPPDGFKAFSLELQLPIEPGTYRFPAVQTYADGVQVSWTDLVEGSPHPAPTLIVVPKGNK